MILDLEWDERIRHVLIFKNHGEEAGGTHHYALNFGIDGLPVTAHLIKAKLVAARDYFALNERCKYCDVLHQELGERRRLIAENDDFACLAPFASGYPFEACVFPKRPQRRIQPDQRRAD